MPPHQVQVVQKLSTRINLIDILNVLALATSTTKQTTTIEAITKPTPSPWSIEGVLQSLTSFFDVSNAVLVHPTLIGNGTKILGFNSGWEGETGFVPGPNELAYSNGGRVKVVGKNVFDHRKETGLLDFRNHLKVGQESSFSIFGQPVGHLGDTVEIYQADFDQIAKNIGKVFGLNNKRKRRANPFIKHHKHKAAVISL